MAVFDGAAQKIAENAPSIKSQLKAPQECVHVDFVHSKETEQFCIPEASRPEALRYDFTDVGFS